MKTLLVFTIIVIKENDCSGYHSLAIHRTSFQKVKLKFGGRQSKKSH